MAGAANSSTSIILEALSIIPKLHVIEEHHKLATILSFRAKKSDELEQQPLQTTRRLAVSLVPLAIFGTIGIGTSLAEDNGFWFTSLIPIPTLKNSLPQPHSSGLSSSKLLRGDGKTVAYSTSGTFQASMASAQESTLDWVKKDKRRFLHVVYCVGDLERTINFYTECLGMKLLRKRDIPEERYTNAFLGYGPEDSHFVIELTYNYGVDKYDIGSGFGHFGISVENVAKAVDLIKAKGGKVTREAGPVKGGSTIIAFIEDPDGYKFELLERGPSHEPFCQVMLRVGDLEHSIEFYEKAYGMKLLRTIDNPEYKYSVAKLGYGPEDKSAVMELTYNYGVTNYSKGNAYAQIAIGTDDVYKTAEAVTLAGGKITREPGPLPGINTKITACLDPDGWKTVFVDNTDLLKELE